MDDEVLGDPIARRIEKFRVERGLDLAQFADLLGVKPITILRWENGTSKPSAAVAGRLNDLGFGEIRDHETKLASTPRADLQSPSELRGALPELLQRGSRSFDYDPAPYVLNGPADQLDFFRTLLAFQSESTRPASDDLWARRLSCVAAVDREPTAQALLERPKAGARAWNGNYGPHGWHRYVGRFPPHLVRAVLNHFGAERGELVVDPFLGSGTTLVEARLLGLRGVGVDLCPLSCTMARAKAQFPEDRTALVASYEKLVEGFAALEAEFRSTNKELSHESVTARVGNPVNRFPNMEKWFTPEALLGVSIAVELIEQLGGYERDFFATALSAEMRSIGNVDVDVVRAEYRKTPRRNVDVLRLITRRVDKMLRAIGTSISSHENLLGPPTDVAVVEGDARDAAFEAGEVDYIVTSPPYGVESLSYLRTHLLSYRSLDRILGHDPYHNNPRVIGSEYLVAEAKRAGRVAAPRSATFRAFFAQDFDGDQRRVAMMEKFFDDLVDIGDRFSEWLRPSGRVAFVIGNKRLGTEIIPTDSIVREIFEDSGLEFERSIEHKLKTNNSNSEVPWQERVIQEEAVLLFRRR